ncbi:DNA primase [Perkinsela sp. CCAP 1560/4]|nr:DNA primase [Perkinsela sp. CCAP 1560/4]|eukprot:KNH05379.1 DNA primase [Perkinsela sp. CCAP 1560/4]
MRMRGRKCICLLLPRLYSTRHGSPPPHYHAQRGASGDPVLVDKLWEAYTNALDHAEFRQTHGRYKDSSCEDLVNEYEMKKKYVKNAQERKDVVNALGTLTRMENSNEIERIAEENTCVELKKSIEEFELNIELEEENTAALKLEIAKMGKNSSAYQLNNHSSENLSKRMTELQLEIKRFDELIKAKCAEYDVLVKTIAEIEK